MPIPNAHNIIRGGTGGLLVAADFPATGRTVAGFSDLLGAHPGNHAVWETAPPAVGDETAMTGPDHVDRWLSDLSGHRVDAVLGFCVGAVYAAAIAERVTVTQGAPVPVIVFDPERPDPDLLHRHYEGLVGGLTAVLRPDELTELRKAGEQARSDNDDMAKLAEVLRELAIQHGGPALRRTGLDERRTAELIDTFGAFLAYLVAAADLDPLPVWRTATALSSATGHSGLNALAEDTRARTVARELRFPVEHTDLLRDKRVVDAVRDLLGEQA